MDVKLTYHKAYIHIYVSVSNFSYKKKKKHNRIQQLFRQSFVNKILYSIHFDGPSNQFRQCWGTILPRAEPSTFSHTAVEEPSSSPLCFMLMSINSTFLHGKLLLHCRFTATLFFDVPYMFFNLRFWIWTWDSPCKVNKLCFVFDFLVMEEKNMKLVFAWKVNLLFMFTRWVRTILLIDVDWFFNVNHLNILVHEIWNEDLRSRRFPSFDPNTITCAIENDVSYR